MNRNTRTLLVVLVAVTTAGLASYGVYRAIQLLPVKEVEVAHTYVVAAAHPLQPGARLTAADLKLVAWPERAPVAGSFSKLETVVDRGVIAQLQENEPVIESKLAPTQAGAGLAPTIPEGMRAISVQVNEVIGVAGFATPGTRVDVLVTMKPKEERFTRVVVSNVQVLTAGTRYEQDKEDAGEAIPSSVVTLVLTPEDAERVVLASSEGQIMLALRNPMDVAPVATPGIRSASLFGGAAPSAPAPQVHVKRVILAPPPPPPPTPAPVAPPPYTVETIRGAKRAEEIVSRLVIKE